MKMPSSCYDCPFVKNKRTNDYGSFCECGILDDYETINLLAHSKHPNCPLIEQEPILDKIRTEIEEEYNQLSVIRADETLELGECLGLKMSLKIINKYKAESEDKGCRN
jgi:hypothetical protein